ncbi:unnamed protein product [Lactuca virosa]|uniref:Transmembrane protein 53 n=1 Tax=Lactuca virosa TaxID=75947 RepID=A0AAU9NBX0_9ASTR|nr:unnamed protein product [Lactuca virosa]
MEASISRSLIKFTNRNSINTILHSNCHPLKLSPHPSPPVFSPFTTLATLSLSDPNSHARNHFPNWKPSHFTPSSFPSNVNTPISADRFARILSGHNDKSFEWKFADRVNGGELGFLPEDKRADVTVVVLGWLGSRQKHLRRKLESRVTVLTDELVSWLEEKENDGRDRFLIFHTFSNTGWLAYGSILNKLQGRQELLDKIKGCVVDSGGDPELDPKVWAAGFTTALLKKQSSAVNSSSETMEVKNVNSDDKELEFIEVFLLTLFEKFFAYLLQLPDIKKRLTEVTSTLSENQPSHPQLYLYSTADKVIPFHKIESFAEHQKKLGKKVTTFNFKSTPHVDHYRTFTDTYRSLVQIFLKDCFALEGKQLCNVVK